jgi:hypothetical protein
MARTPTIPIWPGWFGDVNSLLVSAACHLTALIAMAMIVAAGNTSSSRVQLSVGLSDGADLTAGAEDLESVVELEAAPDDAAATGPVQLFDDSMLSASDLAPLDALSEIAGRESGAEGLALAGFGDGTGSSGQTGKAATDFFGIGGYGQSFVYVVDCSGSMRESGKFERAVYELLRSIEQLNKDQRYFVIFYSNQAYPMPAEGLVSATEKQFKRTQQWVGRARPNGGTYPLTALMTALRMKPDAIYFLSDGLFDPRTSREIRVHNRRKSMRIPIHTIAFVNRESESLMRTIARNSGGKFRFVK